MRRVSNHTEASVVLHCTLLHCALLYCTAVCRQSLSWELPIRTCRTRGISGPPLLGLHRGSATGTKTKSGSSQTCSGSPQNKPGNWQTIPEMSRAVAPAVLELDCQASVPFFNAMTQVLTRRCGKPKFCASRVTNSTE